jgi:ankyrin repeat protein
MYKSRITTIDSNLIISGLFDAVQQNQDFLEHFTNLEELVELEVGQKNIDKMTAKYKDDYSKSPSVWDKKNNNKQSFLTCGVKAGNYDFVKKLLNGKTKFVNAADGNFQTPLDIAASENQDGKMVKILLNKNANKFNRHKLYNTLNTTTEENRHTLIQLFTEHKIDLTLQDEEGQTLQDHALSSNNLSLISYLHHNEIIFFDIRQHIEQANYWMKNKDFETLLSTQPLDSFVQLFLKQNNLNTMLDIGEFFLKDGKLSFIFKIKKDKRIRGYDEFDQEIHKKLNKLLVFLHENNINIPQFQDAKECSLKDYIVKAFYLSDSQLIAAKLLMEYGIEYSAEELINVRPSMMWYTSLWYWSHLVKEQKPALDYIDPVTQNTFAMSILETNNVSDIFKAYSESSLQYDKSMWDHVNNQNQTILDIAFNELFSVSYFRGKDFDVIKHLIEFGATQFNYKSVVDKINNTKFDSSQIKDCFELLDEHHLITPDRMQYLKEKLFETSNTEFRVGLLESGIFNMDPALQQVYTLSSLNKSLTEEKGKIGFSFERLNVSEFLAEKLKQESIECIDSNGIPFTDYAKAHALETDNIKLMKSLAKNGVHFTQDEENKILKAHAPPSSSWFSWFGLGGSSTAISNTATYKKPSFS